MNGRPVAAPVAVIGFGNQGAAQARNLRDCGVAVVVGARPGGPSAGRAAAEGFAIASPADAARSAGTVAVLVPDEAIPALWAALAPSLPDGVLVLFAHGFALLYGGLAIPDRVDVGLVSPTGPGSVLRSTFEAGRLLPAYVAAAHDASGEALGRVRAYAEAIGCGPLWPTTVREETEVDLFGEQVVLCGGMNALVTAAFEVLVARGYAPEIAYLECVHQLKFLADLLYARGVAGFRRGISGTALYGDVTRGPRVIGPESRRAMEAVLEEIRSGAFAREWLAESGAGSPGLRAALEASDRHPIEEARRRALGDPGDPPKTP